MASFVHAKGENYIFLTQYKNRHTAARIIQRQFHELLKRAHLECYLGIKAYDLLAPPYRNLYADHSSEGKVNIFNLAKNAGTSVDQIERFYARNLPLSKEMARNLQSFGGAD